MISEDLQSKFPQSLVLIFAPNMALQVDEALQPPHSSKCPTTPIYIYLRGMVTCPAPFDLLYSIHRLQQKDYELGCIGSNRSTIER